MRRIVSFVSILGLAWLPSVAAAQDAPIPPDDGTPPVEEREIVVEETTTTTTEAVVVEPSPEVPPPEPPSYDFDPEADERHGFMVELQAYGILPLRISGEAGAVGADVPINVRLKDLFEGDQLNIGGGLRLEAWASRLGLVVDGLYLQLERDNPGVAVTDFRSRQFIGDFLGGARLIQTGPLAGGPSLGFAILGGVRMIYDKERFELAGNSVEESDWIAKGSIGGELPIRVSDGLGFRARGQVRYPDFDWTVVGLMEVDSLAVGLDIGYRYENLDYEEGGLDLEVDVHNLYVGIGFPAGGRRQR